MKIDPINRTTDLIFQYSEMEALALQKTRTLIERMNPDNPLSEEIARILVSAYIMGRADGLEWTTKVLHRAKQSGGFL